MIVNMIDNIRVIQNEYITDIKIRNIEQMADIRCVILDDRNSSLLVFIRQKDSRILPPSIG